MSIPDLANGAYELLGSLAIWANCYKVYQDKVVKGVYWKTTAFWASWSLWNLYYYPHIGQWFSFVGGLSMAASNVTWALLAWYFMRSKQ